jgi:hypothetical protein
LPSSFEFKQDSNGNYQLLPKEEEIFDEKNNNSTQEFLGIVVQPEQSLYGLVLYYIQPEKQNYFLENQKDPKITITFGSSNRSFSKYKLEKRKTKGKKIEIVTFQISPEDYESLQNSLFSIIFGTYSFNILDSNLEALRYFNTSVANNLATKNQNKDLPVLDQSKEVKVKGYYRRDGTYVRPHTRRKN